MHSRRHAPVLASLALMAGSVLAEDTEPGSCPGIQGDAARLACYDRAAGRPASDSKPPPASIVPPATAMAAGENPPPTAAAKSAALFGLPPDEARKQAEEELGRVSPDLIEARITAIHALPTGKLELQLDNGQRWAQIDTGTLRVKPGETVRIRRAAFNSYLLQKTSGGAGYRVRRIS